MDANVVLEFISPPGEKGEKFAGNRGGGKKKGKEMEQMFLESNPINLRSSL